jgi:hypothetical protein
MMLVGTRILVVGIRGPWTSDDTSVADDDRATLVLRSMKSLGDAPSLNRGPAASGPFDPPPDADGHRTSEELQRSVVV